MDPLPELVGARAIASGGPSDQPGREEGDLGGRLLVVLPTEVVADELVAGERARALGLDVYVGEVDADGEEARAEGEEGSGGEELPGSGRGAPPHASPSMGRSSL
uniref:Uncharacterized protein n=1 Tax=Arundo donax TaxID=35708 RepID=A0A0A9EG75_ARUDO